MIMNLLELRKYAIDHRVEIRFGDRDALRECIVNERGLVKIPGEDKDLRVDDILKTAQKFEIIDGGVPRHFTRDALAKMVAQSFEKTRPGHSDDEDE
jgi:hypothetical protein